jgi:hypothetical protein
MKKLLKLFLPVAFVLSLALAGPGFQGSTSAVDVFQNTCGGNASNTDVCNDVGKQKSNGTNPVIRILKAAINVVSYIAGIAAIIGIIASGLRLILAGGDANAAASARTGLTYSLVGIAIVAIAQIIVAFVLNRV